MNLCGASVNDINRGNSVFLNFILYIYIFHLCR